MEKTLSLTEGNLLFSKLQCVECGKCLSVEPVSETDGQYICGRCRPQGEQCPLFATIAEHLTFPCVFELCEVQLKWRDVKSHERSCYFRDMLCPFNGCTDRFQSLECQSHFQDRHILHKEQYCSDDIYLAMLTPFYVDTHCILYDRIIFLIFIKIYGPMLNGTINAVFSMFCISSGEDLSNLACEVKITNSNNTVSKTINCNDMLEFDNSRHCLDYLIYSSFSYAIKVYKKSNNSDASRSYSIECPICCNDFSEQIYLCSRGHSFCSFCRNNIERCPFCKVALSGNLVRNFALEDIIKERSNRN
nr:unnamed protein product [Callosobruchus analis]